MNPCDYVWRFKKEFQNEKCKLVLRGHSVSAQQSGFLVENYGIALDAGIAFNFPVDHIFITHSHSDHAMQLPAILTGAKNTPYVYVLEGTADLYKDLVLAKQRMTKNNRELRWQDINDMCKFVECRPNTTFEIKVGKNTTFVVDILETEHKVPSIGFAFSEQRTRLKKELRGLQGKEIALKRKAGEETTEFYNSPFFIYVGDATPSWFERNRELLQKQFPFIICECTFVAELEDGSPERAKKAADEHGHTCWEDLQPLISQSDQTQYILVHWSNRYTPFKKLEQFFEPMANVFAWTW